MKRFREERDKGLHFCTVATVADNFVLATVMYLNSKKTKGTADLQIIIYQKMAYNYKLRSSVLQLLQL